MTQLIINKRVSTICVKYYTYFTCMPINTRCLSLAPPPAPENVQLQKSYEDGAAISWEKPKLHKYFSIKGYIIEYWMFGSTTKKTTDSYKGVASEVKGRGTAFLNISRFIHSSIHSSIHSFILIPPFIIHPSNHPLIH